MGPILIAGGGIGGLTLAAALQAMGREVLVFERQDEVRDTGAGISLWPNALGALDTIGLGDLIRSTGVALASGGLMRPDGSRGTTFTEAAFRGALGDALVCVHRGELVAALAARLGPGTIRTGCAVESYRHRPGGVDAVLRSGESVAGEALVGADGINSAVAAQVAGPLRFRYSGYKAWRGIAPAE
ncbi:MAG TPA: FAD-dependent monooxygenase, partial [Acidimicrobiales bacterium]|nr:FAD-dependent monooxygenase [Acidimicrobiales bacterium]